ncbi:hypothetical protein LI058_05365 [Clostridium perfringens]|uniref:hypothetical protein n=1 Tax=Clostridium perfringens TaxID=1502 RepID=UPI001DCCDA16|nr:hypothetical protein [Clostridium perfringens]EHK2348986.1 hypothetical protein [Clostridium perfringens]MCX0372908.1 hypothetical protein [Clostridium perfringens]
MGRKLLVGILWVTLSLFVLGCSTSGEKNTINIPREKSREEGKSKDEEEYIDKISSTIVNMSVDGSIKNMRTVSETGKLNNTMIKQLERSNNFFKCLIEDLKGVKVPEKFASYNDDIINNLNKAKTSLEAMKNSHDEETIKSNAKIFVESNKEVSNLVDKILVYYAGC